jgi:hypothetical protein
LGLFTDFAQSQLKCSRRRVIPIISQMERAAGFTHEENAQAPLEKLDAVLAQSYTPPQDRALFAELLSVANDHRYPKVGLTPKQRRQQALEALLSRRATGRRRSNSVTAHQRTYVTAFQRRSNSVTAHQRTSLRQGSRERPE